MTDGVDAPASPIDGFERTDFLWNPAAFLSGLEDALQIDSVGSLANVIITVSGVMLTSDKRLKPFSFQHTPNSNRTLASTRQAIGSGWLLRARASVTSGSPLHGQVFVWLRLCRGLLSVGGINGTIASGYITATTDIYAPDGVPANPLDGGGALRSIAGTTPGAGVNISEAVPTGARWELVSFRFQLVTSAAVANRQVALIIDDGTTELFRSNPETTQAASLTIQYSFAQGNVIQAIGAASHAAGPVPTNNKLAAGFRIRTQTNAIDVADQFSNVQYLVREWVEGN